MISRSKEIGKIGKRVIYSMNQKHEDFLQRLEDNINRLQQETNIPVERRAEHDELMDAVDGLGIMCEIGNTGDPVAAKEHRAEFANHLNERLDKYFDGVPIQAPEELATENGIVLKMNNCFTNDPCIICGGRCNSTMGFDYFLAGTWNKVCGACAEKRAPGLAFKREASKEKKLRDSLEHGDPLALFVDVAKQLDYRINETIFKAMLCLTITDRCEGGNSQEDKDTLQRLREEYELERTIVDRMTPPKGMA